MIPARPATLVPFRLMSPARPDPAPASVRSSAHLGRSGILRASVPARHPLVIPLAVLYAAALFAWCALRHRHFGSSAFEMGAYHSTLWNMAFRGTPWNSLERAHQWSTHLELGLAPLVPLYRLAPSPAWLWLAEGAACGAAALPIDAIARRITGDAVVGLVAAAAMLLTPQLVLGQVADFQPIALAILPMAVMAWAIEVDSSRGLVLGAAGAILLREQLGAAVAVAAVLWVLRQGARRAPPAAALALAAVAVSALEIFVIIPSFGSDEAVRVAAQYGTLSGGAQPARLVAHAFDAGRRLYVVGLLSGALPLVFLSLRSLRRAAWPLAIGLIPLLVQLFSSEPRKWDLHYPYGVPVVAVVAAAAVLALRFIPASAAAPASTGRRVAVAGWLVLVLVHLGTVLPSPIGPGQPIDPEFARSARAGALARAIALVPTEASISAQDDVVPHVAERSEIHRWPDGMDTDDYLLLDADGAAANLRNHAAVPIAIQHVRADAAFEVLLDDAGVLLARRRQR
jgi:uncharacterized membrane protein